MVYQREFRKPRGTPETFSSKLCVFFFIPTEVHISGLNHEICAMDLGFRRAQGRSFHEVFYAPLVI
jgi:hypothetical protein